MLLCSMLAASKAAELKSCSIFFFLIHIWSKQEENKKKARFRFAAFFYLLLFVTTYSPDGSCSNQNGCHRFSFSWSSVSSSE